MPEDRPSILVDVDGTLVDTHYVHTVSWGRAFQDIGEEVPMSRIHPLIGATLLGVFGALLAVPVAASIQIIGRHVVFPRQEAS